MLRILTFTFCLMISSSLFAEKPNILFCISDDQSFPHAGAYGCTWTKTPAFDRIASQGLLFNRCYTPNAKCAPSRSCILTGRNSWQLENAANHMPMFPEKFKVFTEVLSDNGWLVGYTGKGWAPGKAPGRMLTGKPYQKRKAKPPAGKISTNDYAGNFEVFLKDAKTAGKPWFFWYGCTEPHRGYEFQAGVNKGGKKLSDIPDDQIPSFWPKNDTVRHDMLDYAHEIEHFDNHLGRMLKTLEDQGLLENTLILVTADNGMPFPRIKGQEYEMSNHLPLAAMWPRGIKKPGRKINDYVNFIDFAPTFLEVAGIDLEKSGMQPFSDNARSLTDIFGSDKQGQVNPDRNYVLIGKERHDVGRPNNGGYPIRGILKDGYLLIKNYETDRWPAGNPETGYLNTDGGATKTDILSKRRSGENTSFWQLNFGKRPEIEFFHVEKDLFCMQNLAGKHPEREQAMRDFMLKRLKEQQDPRALGHGDVFDNYGFHDMKKSHNYYERFMGGEKKFAGWVNKSDYEDGPIEE